MDENKLRNIVTWQGNVTREQLDAIAAHIAAVTGTPREKIQIHVGLEGLVCYPVPDVPEAD